MGHVKSCETVETLPKFTNNSKFVVEFVNLLVLYSISNMN